MKLSTLKKNIGADLAGKLRQLRQDKGLSLQETALLVNIPLQMVYAMEQGKSASLKYYIRLLKLYGKKLEFTVSDLE